MYGLQARSPLDLIGVGYQAFSDFGTIAAAAVLGVSALVGNKRVDECRAAKLELARRSEDAAASFSREVATRSVRLPPLSPSHRTPP